MPTKKTTKRVSDLQWKVLKVMGDGYEGDEFPTYEDEVRGYIFSTIAELANITEREARLACRALKRKGFTSYGQFFNEDRGFCGSGYTITKEGASLLPTLPKRHG